MKRLMILLSLLAAPALAQQMPGLYQVTGVAADDVLNVRENPRATAAITGIFGPNAKGIEVVELSENGDWGHVNFDGGPGWVSMAYLQVMAPLDGSETYLNRNLYCSGTEPFWGLELKDGGAVFSNIDQDEESYDIEFRQGPINRMPGPGTLIARLNDTRLTASVAPRACDDGMSDTIYGLTIDLLVERPGDIRVLEGCCQMF